MGQMMPMPTMVTPTEVDSQKRIRAAACSSKLWDDVGCTPCSLS